MEEWRRSICDSLDQDGISPATGANRQEVQGGHLDLACGDQATTATALGVI